MAEPRFEEVDVLVIDPDGGSRDSIRQILQFNGFRSIRAGGSFLDLVQGTEPPGPDLLICETDIHDGDACQWIHDLRHQRVGPDPFLPVIATTWTPTPDLVKRVIDAGADDLLTKPLSSELLLNRIRSLVRGRKPFVVTSDYIGPDRHRASDRTNSSKLFVVPNRLRARTYKDGDADAAHDVIEEALNTINREKLDRHAERISEVVRRLAPSLESGTGGDRTVVELRNLYEIVEDTSQRMIGTPYEHVSDLCHSLMGVIDALRRSPRNPPNKDLRLLIPLSQAIEASFAGAGNAVEKAREIRATIDDSSPFLDAETERSLGEAESAREVDERRQKFLLRLVVGKMSHLLSDHMGRRQIVPRAFLQGFDEYLVMLLGEALYEELNAKAKSLLGRIDSDDDTVIWQTILGDDEFRTFSYAILIQILLKFSNFARGRRNFMGIVNTAISDNLREEGKYFGRDIFTEGHFNLVFATLFSDVFEVLNDEEEGALFDSLAGPGTAERLHEINDAYRDHVRRSNEVASA